MRSNEQRVAYHEIDQRHPPEVTTGVLQIVIPFTTPELTLAALRQAELCTDLNVYVLLVDIQVVPFSCPIDQPPINSEFSKERLRGLLGQTRLPGATGVVYARDRLEGYRQALKPTSLVIVATQKHWWRTREEKLAGALRKSGHQVMLLQQ